MNPKPGIRTSEFWITAVVNIAGAILAILAARGLVKAEDSDLWLTLVQSLAVTVIPLAMAIVNSAYIQSRAQVKTGNNSE